MPAEVDSEPGVDYRERMRVHSTRDRDASAATGAAGHTNAGRHHLLSPKGVLRLQRSAGNAAVAGALEVQRKHIGKEMLEFSDGTIEGLVDGKHWSLSVTEGWLAG